MSITSIAGERERKSSFCQAFGKTAEQINQFAEKYDFEISGKYNAYFVEFQMSGITDHLNLEIKGGRRLKSTFTGVIPTKSTYFDNIQVLAQRKKGSFPPFSIRKNNVFNKVLHGLTNHSLKLSKKYILFSKDKRVIEAFREIQPNFYNVLNERISEFSVNQNGDLEIELFEYYSTQKEFQVLIDIIKLMDTKIFVI